MSDIGDIVASQGAVVNGILGLGMSIAGLAVNAKQNKRNLAQQQWANAQNVRQAELAYQRSKPTTQVGNMMQAGMSRAGALNAINGGGSYTPSPVQPAQEQMLDFSGLQGGISNIAQLGLAAQQLQEQKRQFDKNLGLEKDKLQLEKDKFQDTANQNAALRNIWLDESEFKKAQLRQINIRNDIDDALKQGTIDVGQKENLARLAQAQLQEIEAQKKKIGYDELSPAQIKIISEYQASLEVMSQFGSMTAQKIIEYLHNIVDSLPFL